MPAAAVPLLVAAARVAHAASPMASRPALADLALLSIVMAHGTDADLDPRETQTLVGHLSALYGPDGDPSGGDLSALVESAVTAYGTLSIRDLDTVVARLGGALDDHDRARAHAVLAAVADADGHLHANEAALLRHIAEAWEL